jgi:hypothetical protein
MAATAKVSKIPATVLHLTDSDHRGNTRPDNLHRTALVVGRAWRSIHSGTTYRGMDILGVTRATARRSEVLAVGDVFEANADVKSADVYQDSIFFAVTLEELAMWNQPELVDAIFAAPDGTSMKGGAIRLRCNVPTVRKGMFPTVIVR